MDTEEKEQPWYDTSKYYVFEHDNRWESRIYATENGRQVNKHLCSLFTKLFILLLV